MLIPKLFLDTGPAVARGVKKPAKVACEGEFTAKAFGEFVDPNDYPDALCLTDQVHRTERGEHFHCYAFFDAVLSTVKIERVREIFLLCLEESWRFMTLLGGGTRMFFLHEGEPYRMAFLRAAVQFAPELDALGPRFKYLRRPPVSFSSCNTAVTTLLQTSGVPVNMAVAGDTIRAAKQYLAGHK